MTHSYVHGKLLVYYLSKPHGDTVSPKFCPTHLLDYLGTAQRYEREQRNENNYCGTFDGFEMS